MQYVKNATDFFFLWLSFGLLIFVAACNAESTGKPLAEPKKPPVDNSAFENHVPQGWLLQDRRIVDVDIDGDDVKDAILTVIEDKNLNNGDLPEIDEERALLVLLGDKTGKYRRLSFAKNALLCASCAGTMGSFGSKEPDVMLYEGNSFVVGWVAGSRDAVDVELRFQFDKKLQQFVLFSDRVEKIDRIGGVSIVTKRDFRSGTQTVGGKVSKIEKKVIPLEAVKYYDYLGYK